MGEERGEGVKIRYRFTVMASGAGPQRVDELDKRRRIAVSRIRRDRIQRGFHSGLHG
jgi:hypothetical protein